MSWMQILDFAYTGRAQISPGQFAQLALQADKWQFKELSFACAASVLVLAAALLLTRSDDDDAGKAWKFATGNWNRAQYGSYCKCTLLVRCHFFV